MERRMMMNLNNKLTFTILVLFTVLVSSCGIPKNTFRSENKTTPKDYNRSGQKDTMSVVNINWKTYFGDNNLATLIDTALANNQELNIILQEIEIGRNEIRAKKGEYLPFVTIGAETGFEKSSTYTRSGVLEEQLDAKPGSHFPTLVQNHAYGVSATWEVDIWKKLRNAKKSATMRYLSSIEGKNFMQTNLVAEIATSYYELMALDNLLDIIEKNIAFQTNALKIVKLQKEAAKVTQLAVNRFDAQLLNTQNLQYEVRQRITETENHIHFLTGRFPKPIVRESNKFLLLNMDSLQAGIPSQLLTNRPDIRQAEYGLAATKLDVAVARANFYPSLSLRAGLGAQSFDPKHLLDPKSLIFNLIGNLAAPLINKNAIKAAYNQASAKQIQAIYTYEQSILNAYLDVLNQLAKMDNFTKSYETKNHEVSILTESIGVANNLFNAARADYIEVLLTQSEALKSKIELVEIKKQQFNAKINLYRALGGGWR